MKKVIIILAAVLGMIVIGVVIRRGGGEREGLLRPDCRMLGGHKWEYKTIIEPPIVYLSIEDYPVGYWDGYKYRFVCGKCGQEQRKAKDKLTTAEKEALVASGAIKS